MASNALYFEVRKVSQMYWCRVFKDLRRPIALLVSPDEVLYGLERKRAGFFVCAEQASGERRLRICMCVCRFDKNIAEVNLLNRLVIESVV